MISIIIPSFNNKDYLALCIESLEKNSHFKNEILVHVNEGIDGTIDLLKKKIFFLLIQRIILVYVQLVI